MIWFIMFPLNVICSILCYLTNWLVVLMADEEGELHGCMVYGTYGRHGMIHWMLIGL